MALAPEPRVRGKDRSTDPVPPSWSPPCWPPQTPAPRADILPLEQRSARVLRTCSPTALHGRRGLHILRPQIGEDRPRDRRLELGVGHRHELVPHRDRLQSPHFDDCRHRQQGEGDGAPRVRMGEPIAEGEQHLDDPLIVSRYEHQRVLPEPVIGILLDEVSQRSHDSRVRSVLPTCDGNQVGHWARRACHAVPHNTLVESTGALIA
jgi:hypothetical protein